MKLKNIRFLYNAAAHFAAEEKYPEGVINELRKKGAESFNALCWVLGETAKQAELMRRYMGETPEEVPTEEEFRLKLRPSQIHEASEIVLNTIVKGLRGDEEDEEEEIDEVLLEMQKKTSDD